MASPASRPRALQASLLALAVSGVALGLLALTRSASPLHSDTTRDLLQARECALGIGCDPGPGTSLVGVVQGSSWIRFLALGRRLGAAPEGLQLATLVLLALAVGVVAFILAAGGARRSAPLGAAVALPTFLWTTGHPVLWNPSLSPLPVALAYLALAGVAVRRSAAAAVAGGAAVALAMDTHVIALELAPVLLFVTAACVERPAAGIAGALAGLGGTLAVVSPESWRINAAAAAFSGGALPLGAGLALACAAGLWLRARAARLSPSTRVWMALLAATAASVGVFAAYPLVMREAPDHHYGLVATPGIAVAVALAAERLWEAVGRRTLAARGFAAVGPSMLAAMVTVLTARDLALAARRDRWSYEDARSAAAGVAAFNVRGAAILTHVQAPTPDLIAALFVTGGSGSGSGSATTLRVVRTWAPGLAGWDGKPSRVVPSASGAWLIVRPIASFFTGGPVHVAVIPVGASTASWEGDSPFEPQGIDFVNLAYPRLGGASDSGPPGAAASLGEVRVEMSLPVDTSRDLRAHEIRLAPSEVWWTIAAVRGVARSGGLPARRVTLLSGSGRGAITFVHEPRRDRLPPTWPPAFLEIADDEPGLAGAVDRVSR